MGLNVARFWGFQEDSDMVLKGRTALLYARAVSATTQSVVAGGRIANNEVDEGGVDDPTLKHFLEAGSEDPSLVSVELTPQRWEAEIDEAARLVRAAGEEMDWSCGLQLRECNWEEVLPGWMGDGEVFRLVMKRASTCWHITADGCLSGSRDVEAICLAQATAMGIEWVEAGRWRMSRCVALCVVEIGSDDYRFTAVEVKAFSAEDLSQVAGDHHRPWK